MKNTCLQCKTEYETKRVSLFCSDKCRMANKRDKHPEQNEQSVRDNEIVRDNPVRDNPEGFCRNCKKEVNPLIYLCQECFKEGVRLPPDTPKKFPAYCPSHGEHEKKYCLNFCECVHTA